MMQSMCNNTFFEENHMTEPSTDVRSVEGWKEMNQLYTATIWSQVQGCCYINVWYHQKYWKSLLALWIHIIDTSNRMDLCLFTFTHSTQRLNKVIKGFLACESDRIITYLFSPHHPGVSLRSTDPPASPYKVMKHEWKSLFFPAWRCG